MHELRERTPPVEPPSDDDPTRVRLPRWVTPLLTIAAGGLLPWTLWLTFSLPSRHVTVHYDLAWVGFDLALAAAFASTSWAAVRGSRWLVPLAAATGTMLLCDAWFDVVTSAGGGEMVEAVLEAAFAELPLAAVCGFIVADAEAFLEATVHRYADALDRLRGDGRENPEGPVGRHQAAGRTPRARRPEGEAPPTELLPPNGGHDQPSASVRGK